MEPKTKTFELSSLDESRLNAFISLSMEAKQKYIGELIEKYYPHAMEDENQFADLTMSYLSSFYVEKLYRSNRFFNEMFIPTYTKTGLIRNIVNQTFFADDDLITH